MRPEVRGHCGEELMPDSRQAIRRLAKSYFMTLAGLALLHTQSMQVWAFDLRERFLTEAPRGWAKLEAMYAQVEGEFTMTEEGTGAAKGKIVKPVKRERFAMERGARLVQSREEKNLFRVICYNDRYSFLINKKSPTGPYVIQTVGTNNDEVKELVDINVGMYLAMPYSLYPRSFQELIADPTTRVQSVTQQSSDGETLMIANMSFTYTIKGGEKKPVTGRFVFSPSLDWALRACETEGGGTTTNLTVEYALPDRDKEVTAWAYRMDAPVAPAAPAFSADSVTVTAFGSAFPAGVFVASVTPSGNPSATTSTGFAKPFVRATFSVTSIDFPGGTASRSAGTVRS